MTLALCVAAPLAAAAVLALAGGRLAGRAALGVAFVSLSVVLGAALVMTQAFVDGRSSLVVEVGRWLPIRGSAIALGATASSIVPLAFAALVPAAALVVLARRRSTDDVRGAAVAATLAAAGLALIATATDLLLVVAGWHVVAVATALATGPSPFTASPLAARRVTDVALLLSAAGYLALFSTSDVGEMVRRLGPELPGEALDRVRTSLVWPSALVMAAVVVALATPLRATMASRRQAPPARAVAAIAFAVAGTALLLSRLGPLVHPTAIVGGALVLAATVLVRGDFARLGRATAAAGGVLEAGVESALEWSGGAVTMAVHRAGSVVRLDEREHRVRQAVMLAVATGMLAFWSLR